MKLNLPLLLLALAPAAGLRATPLTATAAVYLQPDPAAPVVSYLKAGTEPVAAAVAPEGWMAVELPGAHEGYVMNRDISKGLDIREGTAIRLAPQNDAPVLTVLGPGETAEITGLHGRWTQVRLDKKLVGYIRTGAAPSAAASTPSPAPAPAAPLAPPPVTATAHGAATAGQPAPAIALNHGGSSSLPRFFQGRFESTRRPFLPRRPYDWQLKDDAGVRYAYLDVSKLLLTEQIDKYIDHTVVVYGTAKAAPGGKDIVIEVESLQLK